MYSDMCYLIPNEAMGKIPECEDKEAVMRLIKETQQETQENTTSLSANSSRTTKPTKKFKKEVKSTTKPTTTVKVTTTPTTTVRSTAKPMAIVDSTTSLTATREDTTEPWMQNLKQFMEKNNGMVFMQKQNGKTYMNYTIFGPNPYFNSTTRSTVTRNTTTATWLRNIKEFYDKYDARVFVRQDKGGRSANFTILEPGPNSPQPGKRNKRFLPAIIAIGVGMASTVLSVTNMYQISNLKSEVRGVKETLGAIHLATINNEAQILHLNEGQLKLAKELGDTQTALNKTMALVNQHSEILHNHAEALKTILS